MDNGSAQQSSLAGRLVLARKQAGLTTRAVAEKLASKLAISHATIANYEKGRSSPTIDVLMNLAALYGRDLTWFMTPGRKLSGVQFRKLISRVKVAEEEAYKASAQRWLEAYVKLEQHLGINSRLDWREWQAASQHETGAALARRVRRELLDLDEMEPVPSVIDVIEERLGVRILELATAARIDGFAAMYGEDPVIVLNPTAAYDRARLNACHELGHILFGDCHDEAVREKENEDRGFQFAVDLMISPTALREAFKGESMVKLVRFKEAYGISLAAMIYRAEKTGILLTRKATQLRIEMSKRGWRQKEPGQVRADRTIRFERMYEEALSGNHLSAAAVPQVMGVREEEMRLRVQAASGDKLIETKNSEDSEGYEDDGEETRVISFPE